MSLYESFEKVLHSFGMQTITHPVFHNSKVAIRFNIGDNGNSVYLDKNGEEYVANPLYVSACLNRALQIYNSLKSEPDLLVIEGYLCEGETVDDFIASVVSVADLTQPHEINTQTYYNDEDEFTRVFLCWKLKGFNPEKLLKQTILADIGGSNHYLVSSVYYVCTGNNVLFHLYDDRGADLVANKKENIQHIYHKLNDLILDYDREKIDSIFNAKAR